MASIELIRERAREKLSRSNADAERWVLLERLEQAEIDRSKLLRAYDDELIAKKNAEDRADRVAAWTEKLRAVLLRRSKYGGYSARARVKAAIETLGEAMTGSLQ